MFNKCKTRCKLSSTSSSKTRVSRDLFLIIFFFSFYFCLSLDLHELWYNMMSTCLLTEVEQQRATFVLGWATALLLSLMALQLVLVDRIPFEVCFTPMTKHTRSGIFSQAEHEPTITEITAYLNAKPINYWPWLSNCMLGIIDLYQPLKHTCDVILL